MEIMHIMMGILEGLMTMHASGLAHLDLKPGNVILIDATTAKLADFGAACAIDHRSGKLAVGRGPLPENNMETLVITMENKLTATLQARHVPSLSEAMESDRLTVQDLTSLTAAVTSAQSCPGDSSVESNDLSGNDPALCNRAKAGVRFKSNSFVNVQSAPKAAVAARGSSMSSAGSAVFMREPAYSLRDVPMVRAPLVVPYSASHEPAYCLACPVTRGQHQLFVRTH